MSRASAFAPLKGNLATKLFQMYLDLLVADDMHFNTYVNHRETRPFDDIVLYSWGLACGSRLTFSFLPERVMRQFGYTQTIHIHHIVSVPPAMTRRDMNDMFDDYLSHMVTKETQSTIVESEWAT